MGLLTTLLTLPLAPVRGTIWIAEQVREQALREFEDEDSIRARLADLEARYELGEMPEEDYLRSEDELLERLVRAQGHASGESS